MCSGKVYYDLVEALAQEPAKRSQIAITRIEQFYPFAEEALKDELARYQNAQDVLWVQEEPKNMGGWHFIKERIDELLEGIHGECNKFIKYVGRQARASTATGSAKVHQKEQDALIKKALT